LKGYLTIGMKQLQRYISATLFFCTVTFLHASPGSAEDLFQQFSLSGGSLTAAPADAKAPEPGIFTAKYGFKIAKDFIPFMGTGLAYTYQPDTKSGDITKLRTGLAAHLGFSYFLGVNSTLKVDYKYLSLSPDLPRGESRTPPQSLGIGLDIKF